MHFITALNGENSTFHRTHKQKDIHKKILWAKRMSVKMHKYLIGEYSCIILQKARRSFYFTTIHFFSVAFQLILIHMKRC